MVMNAKFFQDLQKKFDNEKLSTEKYLVMNGVWYYKGRVLLDPVSPFCKQVIVDHHNAPEGGYSGYY